MVNPKLNHNEPDPLDEFFSKILGMYGELHIGYDSASKRFVLASQSDAPCALHEHASGKTLSALVHNIRRTEVYKRVMKGRDL